MIIIFNIFFILLFIFILINFLKYKKRHDLNHLCDELPYVVASLGYNIAITGPKGSGKTTSGSGIANYLIIYLQNELLLKMDDIRCILKSVNFNDIHDVLNTIIDQHGYDSDSVYNDIDTYVNILINDENLLFDRYRDKTEFETYYTDFISIKKKRDLLIEYCKSYYIVNFRKKFLISKTYLFDMINGEISNIYDPSTTELRNLFTRKNFQLDYANIIFDDENSIRDGNALSNNSNIKMSGSKDFDALIRNAGKGLIYKIVIKQISKDQIAANRRQIDSTLQIHDRKEFCTFAFTRKMLDFLLKISYMPIKLFYFFKSIFIRDFDAKIEFERYLNKNNKHRKFEFFIKQQQKKLYSNGFIRVRYKVYDNEENVGKNNTKDVIYWQPLVLYFPIWMCYGAVDTHEFSYIFDYYQKYCSDNKLDNKLSKFDVNKKAEIFINETLRRSDD